MIGKFSSKLLESRYMREWDSSPEDVIDRAIKAFSESPEHYERLLGYVKKRWFIPSSPILANSPKKVGWNPSRYDPRTITMAMPISCFVIHVEDSVKGLIDSSTQARMYNVYGGGVGINFSEIRADIKDSKSPGPIPFIVCLDSDVLAFHQHGTRRSGIAAYLDVSHPDIEEFLAGRDATGGDQNRKFTNLHHGVNLSDAFLEAVEKGEDWSLIDPKTKKVVRSVKARDLWYKILTTRHKTGEPYLVQLDEANRELPKHLKKQGKKIRSSNLCSEILLPTDKDNSAICCLSSVNVEYFDEWQSDERFIPDVILFLDNVLDYFIQYASPEVHAKAIKTAREERNIGLGTMGFHSYLQRNMIPFESGLALSATKRIYSHIYTESYKASEELGKVRGCVQGANRRHSLLLAIAPNASTSSLLGASPGIEPLKANVYTHKLDSLVNIVKNRYLVELLASKPVDIDTALEQVASDKGSVQGLDCLSQEEKDVFKTAIEIDQHWVVEHAIMRQPYIDQAASLNLFFPSQVNLSYLHSVHWKAMKNGVKTLYYLRSEAVTSAKINYKLGSDCLGCEG